MIWAHCTLPRQVRSLYALAARMGEDDTPPELLVTGPAQAEAERLGLHSAEIARDGREAQEFLDHWSPDLLLWGSADLTAPELGRAQRAGCPSMLIDAGQGGRLPSAGWRPGRLRKALGAFDRILAVNDASRLRLLRAGAPQERLEALGVLDDTVLPPPCDMGELRLMTEAIGPRPLWFAAEVPAAEIDAVLAAHRLASRQSHRLLLILSPESADDPVVEEALARCRLRVVRRDDDQDPDELHQVLLADVSGEQGLWLRLAPVTYMGGSLSGAGRLSPLAAAALGTAVIHGVQARESLLSDFEALSRVGASLPIANAEALPGALEQLLAPDIAAKLASAAWSVTSAGAPALNRLIELVLDTRDGVLT